MIGKTLGHYRIVDKIGAGGMGEVYRARDERLERDVALKVLPAGVLADEAARKRFRKEALALSKLNHPNIETVHDFDTQARTGQEGTDFLVMEYVPGVTLEEKVSQGSMAKKEVVRLGQQLAEGLAAAHAQGVVHRDLKPGNLRLTPDGRLKILDFGLAKLLRPAVGPGFSQGTATTESLTETSRSFGTVAGTLPYMAPEQLRGEKVDARTDLWAAGAVLYELATGRRPFEAKLATALAADIQTKPLTPPAQLNPKISSRLEEVILKCLEKDPEHRYQSARDLPADFRRLSVPAAPPLAPSPQAPAWGKWAAGIVATLLVVLVGLNVGRLRERLSRSFGTGPPRIDSLAVLPLKNLSADPEQEYFVAGMHEALITELSKISALKVISRTSAMRYKETDKPLPQIARELHVAAVVEGSVLREGDQVRISVQLIAGATDKHLWAENYQRELRGILALQSEVARAIAHEIRAKLTPQEQAQLARVRRVNPESYEAYLKGRFYLNKFTPEGFEKGLAYLQQAIEKDPTNPLPYAGLALDYSLIGHEAIPDAFTRAKAAARKALELGETLAETQEALAETKLYSDWDFAGAEQDFRRALELNPSLPEAHAYYSWYLLLVGRRDEALAEMRRAQEVDPLNPLWPAWLGWQYWAAGQYEKAIAEARKSLELNPDFPWGLYVLGAVYAQKGMYEEAIAQHQKAGAVSPAVRWPLGHTYALAGRREEARKIAVELEKKPTPMDIWGLAEIYTALGEKDEAFRWLEAGFKSRFSWSPCIGLDLPFAPLRDDPRFQALLRRMNLPQPMTDDK